MTNNAWPALPYADWKDTYETLHMWSQVVGKVALALAPPINHSWGIAMQVTPLGLATRTLPYGSRSFALEFDFVEHRLWFRVSDGETRWVALEPRSVANFYRLVMDTLHDMKLPVKIWPMAVEVPSPVRFENDTRAAYDPYAANRVWQVLINCDRVFSETRAQFLGKCSPVHFFWGAFDLAVTRFSGRPAPPREGPAFMREAYSHEVISHGFWPGNAQVPEPVFYAYAVPEPDGFKDARVDPRAARYDNDWREFFLPYNAVRTAADPDATLRAFIETTYASGATLGKWDRAALERAT